MTIPTYLHGCCDPVCAYRTPESTMPNTPYTRCPICGKAWIRDPPPSQRPKVERKKKDTRARE